MANRILWQWWKNPLGGGLEWADPAEFPPPERNRRFYANPEAGGDTLTCECGDVNCGGGVDGGPMRSRPFVITPGGAVPLKIHADLVRNFDFWIGHCDFQLDAEKSNQRSHEIIIKEVPGVETLDVVTRYRFRVGIGLNFDSATVRRSIEKALNAVPQGRNEFNPSNDTLHQAAIAKVADALDLAARMKQEYWVVRARCSRVTLLRYDDRESYELGLIRLRQRAVSVGDILFTSHAN
jgi:hypothetical protein